MSSFGAEPERGSKEMEERTPSQRLAGRRFMKPVIAVALAVALGVAVGSPAPSAAAGPSCGSARWPVKTGTDRDATQIGVTSVVSRTIEEMRGITAPPRRPQDSRVGPTETTVFSITAVITHYVREKDSDYHLVIADDMGRTMVAEVPLPACVFTTNPLSAGIARARAAVDGVLHFTTKLQEASPPVPVRLTGVGFFDTPNHGKGAPANGIELHPVIDIVFNPTTTPTTPNTPGLASARQLLADPGFEGGAAGWVADEGVITSASKRPSHTGTSYAWLGGYGRTHTDALHQEITLPGGASRITLAYYLLVDTKEVDDEPYDTLSVELRTTGGARIATLAEYSNRDADRTYQRRTFNLIQYRGQTVVLWLVADEDHSLQTTFLVDDTSVETD